MQLLDIACICRGLSIFIWVTVYHYTRKLLSLNTVMQCAYTYLRVQPVNLCAQLCKTSPQQSKKAVASICIKLYRIPSVWFKTPDVMVTNQAVSVINQFCKILQWCEKYKIGQHAWKRKQTADVWGLVAVCMHEQAIFFMACFEVFRGRHDGQRNVSGKKNDLFIAAQCFSFH